MQLPVDLTFNNAISFLYITGYKPIVISNSSRQKFFRADHPFFFAIRGLNVTHFMGHVVSF